MDGNTVLEGFAVHSWVAESQLRMAGRLRDGRSFALLAALPAERVFVASEDGARTTNLLGIAPEPDRFQSFTGANLSLFDLKPGKYRDARTSLDRTGIQIYGDRPRAAEDFLSLREIRGPILIQGENQPGKRVDMVFTNPVCSTPQFSATPVALQWMALDIETARDMSVRAISLVMGRGKNYVVEEVLFRGPPIESEKVRSFATESGLLSAFVERVRQADPDILTGWNVLDFDLDVLSQRCSALGISFRLGRTDEDSRIEKKTGGRTKAFISGRQALDALRLVRGSGTRFEDQTLDTVASHVLGTGKTVHARGDDKMAELDRLYSNDPRAFCNYCLEDSRLVLGILEKTGIDLLTQQRAALTGVSLDLAWTSIATFERIYGMELQKRRIVPPQTDEQRVVSGASGGMVLNPRAGLFRNVLVLDFRSLYPSIMRTFFVDPLSHERTRGAPDHSDIVAPNGARFRRQEGIVPELIANYFEARTEAQQQGDETASFVYKILMNSFYGVLGSPGCRYGRTELAGAITSFGRMWLEFSRDFFENEGYRVLYGDTDSVFVDTAIPDGTGSDYAALTALGTDLALRLNQAIADRIRTDYELESHLSIRCEKVYRRFLIPRMRAAGRALSGTQNREDDAADRGRAKGYAGSIQNPDGSLSLEVKGMEAARSDWTALARRFQTELLELVFDYCPLDDIHKWMEKIVQQLRTGTLDAELVYRKSLRRPAQAYEHHETPQIRAARLAGWTTQKGRIDYLMTTAGAEPLSHIHHPIDYEHYIQHQLIPIWHSIADAANLTGTSAAFNPQQELQF